MENINDSVKYRISLDYSMCGEASKLFAAVFSEDENGRGLTMAYLQPETDRRLSEEYQPAAGAKTLRLEVMFRCFGPGEAYFSEPEVEIRTERRISAPRRTDFSRSANACPLWRN